MAKCLFCGKGNWFSSVNSDGLCGRCAPAVTQSIQSIARVVAESLKLAQEGKTFKTRLSRCDTLIGCAHDLLKFEQLGITTIEPAPSVVIREGQRLREQIILSGAREAATMALEKANVASTPKTKESALASGFLKVKEVLSLSNNPNLGSDILEDLQVEKHRVVLDGFLEAAKKAEFKGQTKKAIDQYQEALYFIRNDDVPDEQQFTEIRRIQIALDRLQGE